MRPRVLVEVSREVRESTDQPAIGSDDTLAGLVAQQEYSTITAHVVATPGMGSIANPLSRPRWTGTEPIAPDRAGMRS